MRRVYLITSLFAALAIIFRIPAYGQTSPNVEWSKTFGGDLWDVPYFGLQTKDGGYFLGGYSESDISGDKSQASKGNYDFWVVKTDAKGKKLWDQSYGGLRDDISYTGKQTADGGYIIGGNSSSGIGGDKTQALKGSYDIWVVKLDSLGNKLWDRTFGGNESDGLNSIEQTKDGGYILAGYSNSKAGGDKSEPHRGDGDYWVIKLDANGNRLWDRTYGGTGEESLMCVLQTSDGNYLLGGKSRSNIEREKTEASKGGLDFWIIKIDPNGNIIWDKTLGGDLDEDLLTMQQTVYGGYILGGVSRSNAGGDKSQGNFGGNDYWLVKIDANGNKIWDKTFGGPESDGLVSLDRTADGGYLIGGGSSSGAGIDKTQASKGMGDFWLLKIDENGNKLWDKTLGGSNYELLYFLEQTTDNGFILVGESSSGISGDKGQACQGAADFWMVKLNADLQIQDELSDLTLFPNPIRGEFNLYLGKITASKAELTIFDFLGRQVYRNNLQINNNRISEKLTLPISNGIYLLHLSVGDKILTRKIVVE